MNKIPLYIFATLEPETGADIFPFRNIFAPFQSIMISRESDVKHVPIGNSTFRFKLFTSRLR